MTRPKIVVVSPDGAPSLEWFSDGWYDASCRGTARAECLMRKARAAIAEGADVPDAVRRLEAAGFEVERTQVRRQAPYQDT